MVLIKPLGLGSYLITVSSNAVTTETVALAYIKTTEAIHDLKALISQYSQLAAQHQANLLMLAYDIGQNNYQALDYILTLRQPQDVLLFHGLTREQIRQRTKINRNRLITASLA